MTEWELIEYLLATEDLLPPLQSDGVVAPLEAPEQADALLTTHLRSRPSEYFTFLVEAKSRSTPRIVQGAIAQIKSYVKAKSDPDVYPMIVVPYLSVERLDELNREQVSGIDLCGNGIITIPQRGLFIYHFGNKNKYPETRPVSNPFRGKSAMVGRMFLSVDHTVVLGGSKSTAVGELHEAIKSGGVDISLSQVSKTVAALEEERILGSAGRSIYILDPDLLMERIAANWKPEVRRRKYLRLAEPQKALLRLNEQSEMKWAISGESSVGHHTTFAQGGSIKVAVTNLIKASEVLQGKDEAVANFADVELLETDEPGYYFENKIDKEGLHWAGLLQCWIELRNGDARQQDAARSVRDLIIAPGSL